MRFSFFFILLFCVLKGNAQDVTLFQQFGGRIDFTMIGNTLNQQENGFFSNCIINTSSNAELNLNADEEIKAAFLYWAGSGDGDVEVKLNDTEIIATRVFRDTLVSRDLVFFSAFAEVTEQVKTTGNGEYILSEFDLTEVIPDYCGSGTNFGGWSIVIVYEKETLPLNLINIYDGLQHVPTELTIELTNLNVIDNDGAKIGFLAWEGDAGLSVNESLLVNGNLISNPPLNPGNNAFNGTNSFTGERNFYNMDMDFYPIQDNIEIGDTSATVQLTSGQDFVMVNTIITNLNSQLPDATVRINEASIPSCFENKIALDFTLLNENSTAILPEKISISIYVNDMLVDILATERVLSIGDTEDFERLIEIPESELPNFSIRIVIDEEDQVLEISDNNNEDSIEVEFTFPPNIIELMNLVSCNIGFGKGVFSLEETYQFLEGSYDAIFEFEFYPTEEDLLSETNEINPFLAYTSLQNSQTIYVKTINTVTSCFNINTFVLNVDNCPPTFFNAFSPNGDGINDEFEVLGLKDIFIDYRIHIYNRYGSLVYKGNNNSPNWNGKLLNKKKEVAESTYFYTLFFNDGKTKPVSGWVYLNR